MRSGPVFTRCGSDKATFHRFDRGYDLILPLLGSTIGIAPLASVTAANGVWKGNQERHFLEIGYGEGGSARAWKTLLPGDWVHHSLDLHFPDDPPPWLDLCFADTGNAEQLAGLASVLPAQSFGLIVDDGSHEPPHQWNALMAFWDLLAPGGFYCIEDVRSLVAADAFGLKPNYMVIDTRAASGRNDDLMVVMRKPVD